MEYSPGESVAAARPKRRLLSWLVVPLIAFIAGLAFMGWLLTRWDRGAEWLGIVPAPVVAAPQPVATPQSQAGVPGAILSPAQPGAVDADTGRRVAQLEQRVAQLDLQSRAAVGNADRAEGLLVAFAARRALDRGVALGYIEGLLRQRFAQTQPQAVATIITTARENPVTLQ